MMFLFAGLGNPGDKYENTRHNIGFETIDYISRKNNFKLCFDKKRRANLLKTKFCGEDVIFAKPQTYMNLSGEAIASIVKYYDISLENVFIIYDDIDLEVGSLRIRKFGSAGTHNGMRNIVQHLHSDMFPRLRIGVGKDPKIPLEKYVLGGFPKAQIEDVENVIMRCSDAIEAILEHDLDFAMNRYNQNSK